MAKEPVIAFAVYGVESVAQILTVELGGNRPLDFKVAGVQLFGDGGKVAAQMPSGGSASAGSAAPPRR